MSCLFCRIAAGEIPARIAYQDDSVIAFHDIDPRAPTHVLVIPREHVASVDAIEARHGPTLAAMVAAAQKVARAAGVERSGYRLVFNHGPDAGQSVDHLHLHLLAGRKLTWPPG
ncbi:MAG TPA: histidine triad nucleotide-binding protein [Chloroflexota bacterium]